MPMTDIELKLRVWWQATKLEDAVPAWRDRPYDGSRYAGRRRAAFQAAVGDRKCRSLFTTLDALEKAMFEIRPDWSGGASLGDAAKSMEVVLRQRIPRIPDEVMPELITRYMFSYR